MKILIFLLLAVSVSCTEESTSQLNNNNGGWTLNNGQTANNGVTSNNGKTSNNGQTSNNGATSSTNNATNNGTTNNGTTGTTGGTTSSVRVPVENRPVAIACDDVRPAGNGGDKNFGDCVVDADCGEGANGRCNSGRTGGRCSYDTCFSDSDCGANVCACEAENTSSIGNKCLIGNCQIDADCGTNGFCSPTFGGCGNYSGDVAYFCHTPEDECIDDADCADFGDGGGLGGEAYCKFSTEVERWVCDNAQCVG